MSAPTPLFQQPTPPAQKITSGTLTADVVIGEPSIDVQMAALVEGELMQLDIESADDLAVVEPHLRLVERVIGKAEQLLGQPVGMASTKAELAAERMVTELYRYRRLVRSRRGQLMDRGRQEGSSPRQRALRRLADEHPRRYRELIREEQQAAAQAS